MSDTPAPAPDERTSGQSDEHPHAQRLTHVRGDGSAHMVDVSAKEVTQRVARAQAVVKTTGEVTALLARDGLPKGDALATARIAGIMAAKKTPELIPLCHPLPVAKVTVDLEVDAPTSGSVLITTEVKTTSRTGVEIEALTAATVAALTLYDMIKAVDKGAVITDQMVLFKTGGASGEWARTETETR